MRPPLIQRSSWALAAALGLGGSALIGGRLCLAARAQGPAVNEGDVVPRPGLATKVTLGERGELRVDGKPFLPIFVWLQPIDNFDMLRDLGINTFMAETGGRGAAGQFLDALQERKLWGIIHAQPGNYALKEHPALLTWMFGDEPDMAARTPEADAAQQIQGQNRPRPPRVAPEEIAKQHAAVKEADPSHPAYLNLTSGFRGSDRDEMYRAFCRATDIVGYDFYPVTGWGRPEWVPEIYSATKKLRELSPPRVPVWVILECTTKLRWVSQERMNELGRPKGATAAELRAMVWMSIVGGAKGIGYFPHRWEPYKPAEISDELQAEMKRTNRQLKALSPVILGPDVAGKVTVEEPKEIPVAFIVRQAEGSSAPHLFLVNASTAPARVKLRVSGARALRDIETGQATRLQNGSVALSFEPLQVRLFALNSRP